MNKIKVLLVEDHTMTRLGLTMVLEKSGTVELIGEADNGKDGVDKALSLNPDVVLMDIGLPVMDGIEATRKIKEENESLKVLIFTSRDNEDDVFSALAAGADGYIMKGANEQQMTSAITAVSEGTAWLDPAIARLVLSNIQQNSSSNSSETAQNTSNTFLPQNKKNTYGLTERELEVLGLIVEGLSNFQIAERLVITKSTAKAHVHSVLQKLYVANRGQAAVCAMKEGLV